MEKSELTRLANVQKLLQLTLRETDPKKIDDGVAQVVAKLKGYENPAALTRALHVLRTNGMLAKLGKERSKAILALQPQPAEEPEPGQQVSPYPFGGGIR